MVAAVAVLVALPGLVDGTAYLAGSSSSTLQATATASPMGECGFDTGNTHTGPGSGGTDTAYFTISSGGTSYGAFYSSITVTSVKAFEVGSSGYEYLDGEVDLGCYNVPAGAAEKLDIYISSTASPAASGYQWAYLALEGTTSATGPWDASYTGGPAITYCGPGAAASSSYPATFGGTCSGSTAQGVCTSSTPNIYLPDDYNAAGTWYVYNYGTTAVSCTAGTGIGTTTAISTSSASMTGLGTLPTITNTNTYFGIASFAFGGVTSSANSPAFTITAQACISGSTGCN